MRFWLLKKLLRWYAAKKLDQWDAWEIHTEYGPVYIVISREELAMNNNYYKI